MWEEGRGGREGKEEGRQEEWEGGRGGERDGEKRGSNLYPSCSCLLRSTAYMKLFFESSVAIGMHLLYILTKISNRHFVCLQTVTVLQSVVTLSIFRKHL